jgi:hypothetical protein
MYGLSDEEIAPTPTIGGSVAKALKKETARRGAFGVLN